jgi:hypothetical protein
MNPKTKKLSTGVLALTAIAIWIPQLFTGVVSTARTPRAERVLSDSNQFGGGPQSQWGGDYAAGWAGEPGDDNASSERPFDSGGGQESLAEQLSNSELNLDELAKATKRVDLNNLVQEYQRRRMAASSQAQEPPQPVVDQVPLELLDLDTPIDQTAPTTESALMTLEQSRKLHAVIHGEAGRVALIGRTILREGDFIDGRFEVVAIEPSRVLLRGEGEQMWMRLPPFETKRPSLTTEPSINEAPEGEVSGYGEDMDVPSLDASMASDLLTSDASVDPGTEE